MTSRTIDIHCRRCDRYLFSLQPRERLKLQTCAQVGKKCWYQRVDAKRRAPNNPADSDGVNRG